MYKAKIVGVGKCIPNSIGGYDVCHWHIDFENNVVAIINISNGIGEWNPSIFTIEGGRTIVWGHDVEELRLISLAWENLN